MTLQEKEKFRSYAQYLGADETRFLYCGDIDRAGFDIFIRLCKEAKELHIELFVPAYQKMLELSRSIRPLTAATEDASFPKCQGYCPCFLIMSKKADHTK